MGIETRPIIRRIGIPMMYCPNDTTIIDVIAGTKMVKDNRALNHRERYIRRESSRNRVQVGEIFNRKDIHRQRESMRLNEINILSGLIDGIVKKDQNK